MSNREPKLVDYIGKRMFLSITSSGKDAGYDVTLVGVDVGGIWVESKELDTIVPGVATARRNPYFIPYSQIQMLIPF